MRRFILVVFIFSLFGQIVPAQEAFNILDTVHLDEVTYYGELKKYQSGAKIEDIPAEQLDLAQEGGLENVLMRFTPIYIKSNAGGLSTIRFRGTSPDHTSINFGGINVNSLTLGHSNMSNIPSFLFDGITLQYGNSSAVNGSGAIGGAIYLGLTSNWTNGIRVKAKYTIGSFGEYLYGTKIFIGNGKWESVTRLYKYEKENDFPFYNPYTGDIENPGAVRDKQKGAKIKNMGLLQEVNYRFRKNEFIKSSVWIENSWHQIQPNMQSNYHYGGTQEIDNDNIRVWSEYSNNRRAIKFYGGAGYVHDMQVYDNNGLQKIGTDRIVSEAKAQHDISSKIGYKVGAKYKYIVPNVYSYADSVIKKEEHLDIYLSSYYNISGVFRMTLNLRQMFVSNFKAPFTPSLGAEYSIRTNDESFLKLTSSISRSFRIPTFNDRYWGTQGNPNLKPESGYNFELGAWYSFDNGACRSNIKLNAFYMDVENWIEWRNFGVWQARNVLEVVSKGLEFQANTCFPIGEMEGNFILNYTWNPVETVKNKSETGIVNRQINYVPKQMGNASFILKYNLWSFFADGGYTGFRYANDFGKKLKPYFLTNCGVRYKLKYQKHNMDLMFSSNNILNTNYQNQEYYAMPGVSFRFSIKYDINIVK